LAWKGVDLKVVKEGLIAGVIVGVVVGAGAGAGAGAWIGAFSRPLSLYLMVLSLRFIVLKLDFMRSN
jgi:hypothetical protein